MGSLIKGFIGVAAGFFLIGCSNPGVVQISPDTYMLAKQDHAGAFGNSASFKVEVIKEAQEFAKKQGKVAIPVSTSETPMAPGRFTASSASSEL